MGRTLQMDFLTIRVAYAAARSRKDPETSD
jgi:hypothetical protein